MKVIKFLFTCHLAALVCGVGCLVVIAPHAGPWTTDVSKSAAFEFVLRSIASLYILFGAATMFLFGLLCVGPRKTLSFFGASTLITLGMELLSSRTGAPFGISSALPPGVKAIGLVPYSILFSWFYMGFTSYLLASELSSRLKLRRQTLWSLILGTYFLITWDLALNSAVTTGRVAMPFWIQQAYGSYFGMPISNLLGWILNGLIFLSVSRLLWRADLDTQRLVTWLPFGVYAANTAFAMALNLGIGLWFPPLLSAVFVLLPESLVLVPEEEVRVPQKSLPRAIFSQSVWLLIRAGSLVLFRRKLDIRAEGVEHLPRTGPVVLAARHFHYFYDGYILVRTVSRRLHTIVALEWLQSRELRHIIELACSMADWPVVLRGEEFRKHDVGKPWAYQPVEARHYLRRVTLAAIRLLRSGEALVIFPEGYPNIDPHPTPKPDPDAFMPFQPSFVKFVEMAEKDGETRVAVVPVGFAYVRGQGDHWHAVVRFGPPLFRSDFDTSEQMVRAVEEDVRALSSSMVLPEK